MRRRRCASSSPLWVPADCSAIGRAGVDLTRVDRSRIVRVPFLAEKGYRQALLAVETFPSYSEKNNVKRNDQLFICTKEASEADVKGKVHVSEGECICS